jgi:hypothetical protein
MSWVGVSSRRLCRTVNHHCAVTADSSVGALTAAVPFDLGAFPGGPPGLLLAPQINQLEGVLAIAGELKPYVDVIRFEKSYFETANVAVARRAQVGNIHERKPDVTVVGAEGSGP